MDLGVINLLFLYRKPSMQEISSLKLQYFPTSCGTFTLFSGHLFWVMLLRFCSSGSSDACFLNWSYYSVVNASDLLRFQVPSLLSFLVRKLCYVCVPKTLFFLPWKKHLNHTFWVKAVVFVVLLEPVVNDFFNIECNGLWSVTNLPKINWWNISPRMIDFSIYA